MTSCKCATTLTDVCTYVGIRRIFFTLTFYIQAYHISCQPISKLVRASPARPGSSGLVWLVRARPACLGSSGLVQALPGSSRPIRARPGSSGLSSSSRLVQACPGFGSFGPVQVRPARLGSSVLVRALPG